MSFKGITWAGNVYEKFEAMCLEVEEAMYQDTVKYTENQVQEVGVSVRKFCSEVMDDLRLLSCVHPTSLASDDSSLIPHGFTDTKKQPIPSMLLKKENEESSLGGCDVSLFSPQSPGVVIENKSSEKCAASKKLGVHRRPIGIKRISKNNHLSKESSRETSASEERRRELPNWDKTDSRLSSDSIGVASSSSEVNVKCESGKAVKGNALILENSIQCPACNTEPCNKDFITSRDRLDMEFVEYEEVSEPNLETSEMAQLGQSCILVDGAELRCAPLQGTRGHMSYKKRIREALSLKLKSRKEEERGGDKKQGGVLADDWELL